LIVWQFFLGHRQEVGLPTVHVFVGVNIHNDIHEYIANIVVLYPPLHILSSKKISLSSNTWKPSQLCTGLVWQFFSWMKISNIQSV
jgi:hypothetical protein